jgi:hypothetical protein
MRRRAVIVAGAAGFIVFAASETARTRRLAAIDAERDAFRRLLPAGPQNGRTCPMCGAPLHAGEVLRRWDMERRG